MHKVMNILFTEYTDSGVDEDGDLPFVLKMLKQGGEWVCEILSGAHFSLCESCRIMMNSRGWICGTSHVLYLNTFHWNISAISLGNWMTSNYSHSTRGSWSINVGSPNPIRQRKTQLKELSEDESVTHYGDGKAFDADNSYADESVVFEESFAWDSKAWEKLRGLNKSRARGERETRRKRKWYRK